MGTFFYFVIILIALPVAASASRREADFDWAITPVDGYPIIAFGAASQGQEVIFKYDTPQLHVNKTYQAVLYQNDCLTSGDRSLSVTSNASVDRELTVELDVNKNTISSSTYWSNYNITTAILSFCLRVDYYLYNESVNFHETNVTITIDLRAGFNLTNVNQTIVEAQQYQGSESFADYPVIAYHCDDSNALQSEDRLYMQGDMLHICVEVDASQINNVHVTNISSLALDQANTDGSIHRNVITSFQPDDFTTMECARGICNMQTQLLSQWFNDANPGDVVASGEALLSFGSGATRSLVRFPIVLSSGHFRMSQRRHLQGSRGTDKMFGKFEVDARLAPASISSSQNSKDDQGDNIKSSVWILFYVLIAIAVLMVIGGLTYFLVMRRRNGRKLNEVTVDEKVDLVSSSIPAKVKGEGGGEADEASTDNMLLPEERSCNEIATVSTETGAASGGEASSERTPPSSNNDSV